MKSIGNFRKSQIDMECDSSNIGIKITFLEDQELNPAHRIRSILVHNGKVFNYVNFAAYAHANKYAEVEDSSIKFPVLFVGSMFRRGDAISLQIGFYKKSLVEVSVYECDTPADYIPYTIRSPKQDTPPGDIIHVDVSTFETVDEKIEGIIVSYVLVPESTSGWWCTIC